MHFYRYRLVYFIGIKILLVFFMTSCRQLDVYEKNKVFSKYEWNAKDTVSGSIEIKDSGAYYNLFFVIRHTDRYKYNNIWIDCGIKKPGDQQYHFNKFELFLGDDLNGWYGSGMNDIWDLRIKLNDGPVKFNKGVVEYQIVNVMRDNPLAQVMSSGFRVEKTPSP